MIEIQIPRTLNKQVETFIKDDCVKRVFGYASIQDFIVESIEGQLYADRDIVLMRD